MFYTTGMCLQHTDFKSPEETILVFKKIHEVLSVLNDHAMHEKKFILPMIFKYDVPAVRKMEEGQTANESIAHRLKNLISLYHYAVTEEEQLTAGNAVYKAFNEFISFNLQHINTKEETLNKLLWLHYSDEEIYCIYKAITVSIPADKIIIHGRWVMRGINNCEIINWLLSYHGWHPEAFQFLLQLAEEELSEDRWNFVQEALCEGEMMPC